MLLASGPFQLLPGTAFRSPDVISPLLQAKSVCRMPSQLCKPKLPCMEGCGWNEVHAKMKACCDGMAEQP